MEIYLKKYFWVVHVLVIAVCATLAAKGTNHVLEAKYLLGDARPRAAKPRVPKPTAVKPPTNTKDETAIVGRNIFCSTCEPPRPAEPAAVTSTAPVDPDYVPTTSLPLALLATSVSTTDEAWSSATISNTQTQKAGSYWLHEHIPDAGEIVAIRPRYVDFHNRSTNRVERVDLLGAAAPPPAVKPPPTPTPVASGNAEADLTAEIDQKVRKIDDTHYEIERSLVDKVLNDPSLIARSARIVPSIKDGKANGFKMYAIRPNSVYAKIGLQNGDTIHSVNGFEITSPDKALEVYTKVKSASSLSVQITRRGQLVTLEYTIK